MIGAAIKAGSVQYVHTGRSRWHLDSKPDSLAQLTVATNELERGIAQSHYFEREPDFARPVRK
jgi:hypothetical protein